MMEIEGADGSKLALKSGSKIVLGRGSGFKTSDRTVSRHHVLLQLEAPVVENGEPQEEPRVSFEVTGKNPVWVRSKTNGEVKVFKKSEKGEVEDGDWLCISSRIPVWFAVKKSEEENGKEEERDLESESGAESVDVDDIDPVKEFGFLVMGHEFDQYPNQSISNVKNWDWFLEESEKRKDSEDDDDEAVEKRGKGGKGTKRRKGDDDDDDWTGESDDDKEVIPRGRKARRADYSTRSKDRDKSKMVGGKNRSSVQKKTAIAREEDDLDEDDETLGGFIVEDEEDAEDAGLEEESELDEEEAEDFEDEDE